MTMVGFRTRLERIRRDDRGITVVELSIYMFIAAIVLTISGLTYVNVARSTVRAADTRSSTAEAQNALDVVTSDVRAATNVPVTSTQTTWAVLDGSPTQLTLITYTDAGPTFGTPYQVRFFVDAQSRLVLQQWNPPAGTTTFPRATGPTSTRILANGVQSTSIFAYLDQNGAPLDASRGLSSTDIPKVGAVTVSIAVKAPNSSAVVTAYNTIWMPNAGLSTAYAGAN